MTAGDSLKRWCDPTITPRVDWKLLGNEFVPRDGQAYNYNPTNFFQRPDDRMNAGFFGKYEVSDNAEVYVESYIYEV